MSKWLYESRPNVITAKPAKIVVFRDLNPDFTLISGENATVEEDNVYKKQIRHLLSTPVGSEDFEPTYGSNVPYRLHEPICDLTAYLLETDTIIAFSRWLRNKVILVNPRIIPYPENDMYVAMLPFRKVNNPAVLVENSFEFGA